MGNASEKFDRELFTLKLTQVAYHREPGNATSLMEMAKWHLADLRGWTKDLDRICREVWSVQCEMITPEFVREVLVAEVTRQLGTRPYAGKTIIERTVHARAFHDDPGVAVAFFANEINKLRAEVKNRYRSAGTCTSTYRL